jgi:hypothetical protein
MRLNREEKMQIITACISGVGSRAVFNYEDVKNRIQYCIQIAEEVLNGTNSLAFIDSELSEMSTVSNDAF